MSGMEEFDGVLDLSGADESAGKGFEPVPSGSYECHVEHAEWKATSNPGGKLPVGTPYLNLWHKCDEEEDRGDVRVKNKVFFQNLFVPPTGYDETKAATMKGSMLNTLLALGYTREEISKKGFRVDPDKVVGRQATVVVGRKKNKMTDEWENPVQGLKPAGSSSSSSTSSSGALV